ncbi:MAG: PHP domain-containing protein [Planctomycetia bacterium]|nr:PHP domain-containing protein [Planctomycetia bacterium]
MPANCPRSAQLVLLGALYLALAAAAPAAQRAANAVSIEPRLVHLRSGEEREWSEFPETAQGRHLEVRFSAAKNDAEHALRLRQQDVKQAWRVALNGKTLGELVRDENDMVVYFAVPAGALVDGENTLRVEPASRTAPSDDIRAGEITLRPWPLREVLNEATVEVEVLDAATNEHVPSRITIVDRSGSLQTTGATSNDHLAVRPGVVFTSTGRAEFGLPAGTYTIYAGRGFEWSLAKTDITVAAGPAVRTKLTIRREVSTSGYVACDTHVHTLTHSGHGDATIAERMITIAAEGIELAIATDHNVHVDYEPHALRLGVRKYFTPVIGNEVTTTVGHFNIFPVRAGAAIPDYQSKNWAAIFDGIYRTPDVKAVILNHARDLHGGTRPFGPKLYNAPAGENLDGWPMRFNAMEVVNSGATQSDPLQLFHDWMGLLNAGRTVTPVGSSDSHDVARHFIGQGRTYIRCDDRDVSRIDVDAAVNSFLAGRVMVSYGLLAELTIDGKYTAGDLAAPSGDDLAVGLRVLGPHWVTATSVRLYANGQLVREEKIPAEKSSELSEGVKWQATWKLPRPKHDVHLVAIALGDGVDGPHWKTAKPYQPTSPDWEAHTIGCSGAIFVDGDLDGRRACPRDYAQRLLAASAGDVAKLVAGLAAYDAATAVQAAHLDRTSGGSLESADLAAALQSAAPHVQQGFRTYLESWRENAAARATK